MAAYVSPRRRRRQAVPRRVAAGVRAALGALPLRRSRLARLARSVSIPRSMRPRAWTDPDLRPYRRTEGYAGLFIAAHSNRSRSVRLRGPGALHADRTARGDLAGPWPGPARQRPQPVILRGGIDLHRLITLGVQSNLISTLRAHDWSNRILVFLVLLCFPDENAFTTT